MHERGLTGREFTDDRGEVVTAGISVWDGSYAEGYSPASDGWFCNDHDSEEDGEQYLVVVLGFTVEEVRAARQRERDLPPIEALVDAGHDEFTLDLTDEEQTLVWSVSMPGLQRWADETNFDLMRCGGCAQEVHITEIGDEGGKTECGGEGEGGCCIVFGESDACREAGHEPHDPELIERTKRQHEMLAKVAPGALRATRWLLNELDRLAPAHINSPEDRVYMARRDEVLELADRWPGQIRDEVEAYGLPV